MQHYSEALRLEPGSVAVLGNRSAAALMLKRFEVAIADCAAILALDPTYVKAYSRLSKAHLGQSNLPEALRWAQQAAEREPGSAALRTVRRRSCARHAGRAEHRLTARALQELAEVRALQRAVDAAREALEGGQTTTAMAHAQRVFSRHPDLALQPLLLVLGEAQLKLVRASRRQRAGSLCSTL